MKDIPRSWLVAAAIVIGAAFVAAGIATFDQWSGLVSGLLGGLAS